MNKQKIKKAIEILARRNENSENFKQFVSRFEPCFSIVEEIIQQLINKNKVRVLTFRFKRESSVPPQILFVLKQNHNFTRYFSGSWFDKKNQKTIYLEKYYYNEKFILYLVVLTKENAKIFIQKLLIKEKLKEVIN